MLITSIVDGLASNLPVPVINPGPLTYKLADTVLSLNLTQSRKAYPKPNVQLDDMIHAMLDGGAKWSAKNQ